MNGSRTIPARPPRRHRRHRLGIAGCGALIAVAAMVAMGSAVSASTPAPGAGSSSFLPFGVTDLAPDDVYLSGAAVASDGTPSWQLRHWDGHTWSVTAGPGETGYLDDVTAVSRHDIWAVGLRTSPYGPMVVHGHPGAWDVTTLPGSPYGQPASIVASSDSDVWVFGTIAYGLQGIPYAYHFDGTSWTSNPPFSGDGSVLDATMTGPDSVWAVGFVDGKGVLAHWDGKTWQLDDSHGLIEGIDAVRPNNIWGVGDTFAGVGPLTVHGDGSAWTDGQAAAPRRGTAFLLEVAGTAKKDVWAVGDVGYSPDEAVPLIEHWDGTAWSRVPVRRPKGTAVAHLTAVDASGPDDAWAVGSGAGAPEVGLVEHWDGTAWLPLNINP